MIERGGNVAVQLHMPAGAAPFVDADLVPAVERLGGTIDTRVDDRFVVRTLPLTSGFEPIEREFGAIAGHHPGVEWYYANVYDPDDGITPLNWW